MYSLNIVTSNPILFGIFGFIIMLNLICILYLVIKERKGDKQEENDIVANLITEEKEEDTVSPPLDEVLEEMQKNLETSPEEAVSNFEQEQEEKSIISYQELVQTLKSEEPVFTEMKEELKKEIKDPEQEELKDQLKETIQTITTNKQEAEAIEEKKKKEAKKKILKATEFISPIFGKMTNNREENKPNEQHQIEVKVDSNDTTFKKDTILKEGFYGTSSSQNEEFLRALKEFRKNLE